jgi:hypothetical protein
MAIVLEGVLPKGKFFCVFLSAEGLNAKDIHKEMFPVYGGECKWFTTGLRKSLKDIQKSHDA